MYFVSSAFQFLEQELTTGTDSNFNNLNNLENLTGLIEVVVKFGLYIGALFLIISIYTWFFLKLYKISSCLPFYFMQTGCMCIVTATVMEILALLLQDMGMVTFLWEIIVLLFLGCVILAMLIILMTNKRVKCILSNSEYIEDEKSGDV